MDKLTKLFSFCLKDNLRSNQKVITEQLKCIADELHLPKFDKSKHLKWLHNSETALRN